MKDVLQRIYFARIQPTYEELKRRYSSFSFPPPSRIQPTYEELKPLADGVLYSLIVGIQPTYEELKPQHFRLSENRVSVSSLPMRN